MDDKSIVQMYWERDEKAIQATAEKYGAYCLSIAGNIVGNREDAEECVSDAYLCTWNSIPSNRPKMLSTYLGKIVRNLSFNRYKKNRMKKRGAGQTAAILDELAEVLSDPNAPEDECDLKLLTEAINSFLAALPAEKRAIFVSRYWYADSVKDIAGRFGLTENKVSVSLNRLRTQLRKYLIESGFEL